MRLTKLLELLLLVTLMSLLTRAENASTSATFYLPSTCPTSCGNTSISYPFGIGDGCFRPGFNLTCNRSYNPPKLFLGDNAIEITSIYTNYSFLVMQSSPVRTMSVEVDSFFTSWPPLEIGPATYLWQSYNYLWVSGCSVSGFVIDLANNNTAGACSSVCPRNWTSPAGEICDGIGCCSIEIPWNLTSFGVQLTRLNQSDTHLAEASTVKIFLSDVANFTNEGIAIFNESTRVEATLQWFITDQPSCDAAMKDSSTYACLGSNKTGCYDYTVSGYQILGYYCECYDWVYQGNPYVPNGCMDPSSKTNQSTNCTRKCGNFDVPFPFGIEPGCYRDISFSLICNWTVNPPILSLLSGDTLDYAVQVVNISVEEGKLEIKTMNPWICSGLLDTSKPFGYSGNQAFTLNWVIDYESCNDAMKNKSSFACVSDHSICLDTNITMDLTTLGYRCQCSQGFDGNPYIFDDCQDIDECKFPELYVCEGICINTMGGYICNCPPGTDGDPKRGPCIPNKKQRQVVLLGVIVGVSVGSGMLFLTVSLLFLGRMWNKKTQRRIREKFFQENHGLLLQQLLSSNDHDVVETTTIYSLEELEKATNNFDDTRILGLGGHGTVYKGILSDQRIVAIKKSKFVTKKERNQFINEVTILSQINHRNIIKLFGCCLETEVPLLVYEFISNGTLSDHLYTENYDFALSWKDRLRIATETAGALAYLHSAASMSIFHRDVKSSNILLDGYHTAKVSDFGTSRFIPLDQSRIRTAVQGTFGYLDPEYYQTGQLTEKSDVYSFGVILVELLTRHSPTSLTGFEEGGNLLMHFLQAVRDDSIFELIEDRVIKEGTREEIQEVIQLAEVCLKLKGHERPTMKEVGFRLQDLRIKDKQKLEQSGSVGTSKRLTGEVSNRYSLVMEIMSSMEYPR